MSDELKSVPLIINNFDHKLDQNSLYLVGDALIEKETLIGHHLKSANNFYTNGIRQIITEGFDIRRIIPNKRSTTDEDKQIEYVECVVKFTDVRLDKPTTLNIMTSGEVELMPHMAQLMEKTYSSKLSVGFEVTAKATLKNNAGTRDCPEKGTFNNFLLGRLPVIKGSVICNTYGKTKEALMEMGEDPMDPGGYFIVKSEWAIDCTESTTFNQEKIYINKEYGKSRCREEYISKPGDTFQNSDLTIFIFNKDDTFTIRVARDKLDDVDIPFFLLFRALGWKNDKDLLDWIVGDYEGENEINKNVLNCAVAALNAKYGKTDYRNIYNEDKAIEAIMEMIPPEKFAYLDLKKHPENYAVARAEILKTFDVHLLPHIGLNPNSRNNKMKFLALHIRKIFLVYLEYVPPADRDSYVIKRIHAAGDNYAKTFKTLFNKIVAVPIKRQMAKLFNSLSFSNIKGANLVQMVKSAISNDFERASVQSITAGNKTSLKIKRSVIKNRLMAQQLNRKNQLSMYSTMRQISNASSIDNGKQSERASEMRRVHMSAIGYICVVHSPTEGEKVGINKQFAMFATIAPACSSEALKKFILDEGRTSGDVIHEEKVIDPLEIYRNKYSRVFVNGYLIGYTKNSIELVKKYRKLRRQSIIDVHTTIYWNNVQDEVHFFVDFGRITRPLIIVYNTIRDADVVKLIKAGKPLGGEEGDSEIKGAGRDVSKTQFEQGIAITAQDITDLNIGRKGIDDLVREQKVEYITPEEQQNCYICYCYDKLVEDKNNDLVEYTHCDIPEAILGITALTSPFANHNPTQRLMYQTSQAKKTCGFYAGNWPYRVDKDAFLQYVSEMPLIRTVLNKYICPNGNNCIVAMMCYLGYNQEDSLMLNKAAIDRGLFNGCKFTFEKTEIEQKETVGDMNATVTENVKSDNYSKLVNGKIPVGTHVFEGDVLISKVMKIASGTTRDSKYTYVDRSLVYKDAEEAIVHESIDANNEDANRFIKIGLKKIRPPEVGDKFSSRSGQKGIAAQLLRESDMPTTISGIKPDIIFNPHGMPSRMTCAQLIETLIGKVCAIEGTHYDGTIFKPNNIEQYAELLEKHGFHKYGYERLINGLTGEFIDSWIFMGPTYYQRLQKFVKDAEYTVRHALTDALTNQPLEGKASDGGLRIGEMERDVLCSHGVSRFLREKFFNHSDGYIEYICRCGKSAVVNHDKQIYQCNYCKDNAVIYAIPTSWTSKLAMQEIQSCNVGIRRIPKPYIYERNDDGSLIEPYDENAIKRLIAANEDNIDDGGVGIDDD